MPDEVVYPPSRRRRDRDVDAGSGDVHEPGLAREERDLVVRVSGRDGEHVRESRRIGERVAEIARVPGRRHDERPEADRLVHRGLDRGVLRLRAQAQVDDGLPRPGGGEDALHDLARLEPRAVPDRRVEGADHRLRVDADETDPVHRRSHHGRDRGSVDPADRGRFLRIQGDEIRPPGELLMPERDTGVDERYRHPGPRRREAADADDRTPPLARHERIGEVRPRSSDRVRTLLLGEPERVPRAKRRDDPGGTAAWKAPQAQLHVHHPGAVEELPLDPVRLALQLDERRRRRGCPGAVDVRGEGNERRHARERQSSGQKEAGRPAHPVHAMQ